MYRYRDRMVAGTGLNLGRVMILVCDTANGYGEPRYYGARKAGKEEITKAIASTLQSILEHVLGRGTKRISRELS